MGFKISLAAARVNAGLTQKKAAAILKVSNSTLGKWEKGESFPNAKQIENICKVYDVAYDNLYFLS